MPPTKERRPAGRPPKIANGARRWEMYVDPVAREVAEQRAHAEGKLLPDVMRALMAEYAAGRIPVGVL